MPDDARCAGLTLIGWLARRMPGEPASTDGVEHARQQLEVCLRAKMNGLTSGETARSEADEAEGARSHAVAHAERSFEEQAYPDRGEEVAPKSGPRKSGPAHAGSNGTSKTNGKSAVSISVDGSERVPRPG